MICRRGGHIHTNKIFEWITHSFYIIQCKINIQFQWLTGTHRRQNSFSLTETLLGKYLLHSLFKKYHTYSLFIEIKEIMIQWFRSFWDKKFLELHFFSEISLLCIQCHIYPHEPSYHFTLTKQYLVNYIYHQIFFVIYQWGVFI